MDGVLVNSEPVIRACAQETAKELGFSITDETYVSWMGLPSAQLRRAIGSSMAPKFPMEEFYEGYKNRWREKLKAKEILANPGIPSLLKQLHSLTYTDGCGDVDGKGASPRDTPNDRVT